MHRHLKLVSSLAGVAVAVSTIALTGATVGLRRGAAPADLTAVTASAQAPAEAPARSPVDQSRGAAMAAAVASVEVVAVPVPPPTLLADTVAAVATIPTAAAAFRDQAPVVAATAAPPLAPRSDRHARSHDDDRDTHGEGDD